MMKIELYKKLYKKLLDLASIIGIDETGLQRYFIPEGITSSESILVHLCSSLQNSGIMRNSIKFNNTNDQSNRCIIKKVLFDFNAEKSATTYSNWKCIYNAMLTAGITDNGKKEKKESNWEKYCCGLFDGLQFLTVKNGKNRMKELIATSTLTDKELNEISTISKSIHGLGFALTCDWLKECGCTWLAKPDVHISKVVKRIQGCKTLKDTDVIQFVFEWSKAVEENYDKTVTAYKIDKMIWLLCTGNFYLDHEKFGREAIYYIIDAIKDTQ